MTYLHENEGFEQVFADGLEAWVQRSERRPRLRLFQTRFHGRKAPPIKLRDYVRRIMRYSSCSSVCYSIAYALMLRLANRFDDMVPTALNVHRLVLVSVVLAIKSNEDVHFDNLHFSKVGGLSLAELNDLEVDMLHRLDFRLTVRVEQMKEGEAMLLSAAQEFAVPKQAPLDTYVSMQPEPARPVAKLSMYAQPGPRKDVKQEPIGEMLRIVVR
mmetsp:Transcript_4550/g.13775  ORF Transcript_4550/g.13775 Transcript_4550/m.13775 type:complete len:214 (+) Transcript_4550:100-741(+)